MGAIITVSIDLNKIDQSKVVEKNGKRWLNLNVSVNDTNDQFGNNCSASINQTQEERTNKLPKAYLGNGRVIWNDGKINNAG